MVFCPLAVTGATNALPALQAGTYSIVRPAHCWRTVVFLSALPVIPDAPTRAGEIRAPLKSINGTGAKLFTRITASGSKMERISSCTRGDVLESRVAVQREPRSHCSRQSRRGTSKHVPLPTCGQARRFRGCNRKGAKERVTEWLRRLDPPNDL